MSDYLPVVNYNGTPLTLYTLNRLRITKGMNRHAKAYVTGMIQEADKDSLLHRIDAGGLLEIGYYDVYQLADSGTRDMTVLFTGTVDKLSVVAVQNGYTVKMSAFSLTYQLDREPRCRSYQEPALRYEELIGQVLDQYTSHTEHNAFPQVLWSSNVDGRQLDEWALQYQETDWAFLKRMASLLNVGLISGATRNTPYVHFGLPEEDIIDGVMEAHNYTITRKLGVFSANGEEDLLYYNVQTTSPGTFLFTPGKKVTLKLKTPFQHAIEEGNRYYDGYLDSPAGTGYAETSRDLYVYRSVTTYDNDWTHETVLTSRSGLRQKTIINRQLQGVSLQAKVIGVKGDRVNVHFATDGEEAPEISKTRPFPQATFYTSEGHTGWYCMPEVGDTVSVYFPSNHEKDGIITHSVRMGETGNDEIGDPAVKIFMTRYRKAIIFQQNEILITGNDDEVVIRLLDDHGIEIRSRKDIRVNAGESLYLEAGNTIQIRGGEGIGLECKANQIELTEEALIRGANIKLN